MPKKELRGLNAVFQGIALSGRHAYLSRSHAKGWAEMEWENEQ